MLWTHRCIRRADALYGVCGKCVWPQRCIRAATSKPVALRRHSTEQAQVARVCIVGSGPAGFYTAKYTLKSLQDKGINAQVDILEALPTPFGLVRSGVAPDHPEVKAVQNDFAEVANSSGFRFYGNVRLGQDISLSELQQNYSAIVLAYGAESGRRLNMEGEDASGVLSARDFVNWYNGHPDFASLHENGHFNLSNEDVVIIGNGNVALDCARILLKPMEELKKTDIADHAEDVLSNSNVRRVHIVGRRGHVQAAFTIKELREMTRIQDTHMFVLRDEFQKGKTEASQEELEQSRAKRRIEGLLDKHIFDGSADEAISQSSCSKQCILRFLLSPKQFETLEDDGIRKVSGVKFLRTELSGPPSEQNVQLTEATELIEGGLALKSIGYASSPVSEVPFDHNRKLVPSVQSRVTSKDEDAMLGVYVAGWLRRGPTGIIGTNISDAKIATASLVEDIETGSLRLFEDAGRVVDEKCPNAVPWSGWDKIDQEEKCRGETKGKLRSKIIDREEMLRIALQSVSP